MRTGRRARVLIAKAGLDGHDRGAKVIASALRDAGFEVIYEGLRATVEQVAAIAEQEDVDLVGLSVLSGAHESLCRRLLEQLKARGVSAPVVIGGVIPPKDVAPLLQLGVAEVFGPETPLQQVVERVAALATGAFDRSQPPDQEVSP